MFSTAGKYFKTLEKHHLSLNCCVGVFVVSKQSDCVARKLLMCFKHY